MSDQTPKPFFDEEKKHQVREWINKKCNGGDFVCECCGNKTWTLSSDILTPIVFASGLILGGNSYPSVAVVCTNCANTKFFNVAMMRILPQPNVEKVNGGEDGSHSS